MTCIVGVIGNKQVILAADSLASTAHTKEEVLTPKLISLETTEIIDNHMLNPVKIGIGYTSSFRMGDILTYNFSPPKIQKNQPLTEYMVKEFIPELIDCFDKHSFTRSVNAVKEGGCFLVAIKERLFIVQTDFSVLEPTTGYSAVGSGSDLALGSLHTSAMLIQDAKQAAELAVKAASQFCTSVGGAVNLMVV